MKTNQKFATGILAGAILMSLTMAATNAFAGPGMRSSADTNGDMAIDLTEAIAAATTKAERRFEKLDTDVDGFVTFEEFTASERASTDLTEYAQEIVDCVAQLKADYESDTIVVPSVDDFSSPQEKFDAIDSNLDGVIELSEATDKAVTKATEKFNTLDTDLDGLVTKEERKANRSEHRGTKRATKQCIAEITAEDDDL